MSSHHIVRDDQEPALIIANGESCSMEIMNQLLEWSPLVIVLDSAMDRVVPLGIKVDVLLGDFDRGYDPVIHKEYQYPLEIIHAPDQNKTDLEKALDYLIERKIPAVNVIWATGRRADHNLANVTSIVRFKDKIKVVLIDDYSRVYRLPEKFEKWFTAGTIISLMPVGEVTGITSSNLKYELKDATLTLGYRIGSSNEAEKDGIVSIAYKTGDLLMMECFD